MASRSPAARSRAAAPVLRRAAFPLVAALAAATLMALIGFGSRPALAAPPSTDDPAKAAAGWLARQLVDGERFSTTFEGVEYPDQGLSIDALFGLAAAGVAGDNAGKIINWLATPAVLNAYLGTADDPYFPGFSAGSTAKTLLAAQVTGKDTGAFGGVDLITRLVTLQKADGRFSDTFSTDFSNALGQSLAVIALDRAGGHSAQTALGASYLAGTQCDDGGYPVTFGDPVCDSQVDATAYVVQALLTAGDPAAATDGVNWLISKQKAGGGFTDDNNGPAGESPVNTNSTGLAAQALALAGHDAEADLALAFVRGLQVDCSGEPANRGAIAYTAGAFDSSTAPRSTAQAILGLVGTPLAQLSTAGAQAQPPALQCALATTPGSTPPTTTTATPTATTTVTTTTSTTVTTTTSTAAAATTTSRPAGTLPVTGTALRPILFGGAGLIVVGAALLVGLRLRRRTTEA